MPASPLRAASDSVAGLVNRLSVLATLKLTDFDVPEAPSCVAEKLSVDEGQ